MLLSKVDHGLALYLKLEFSELCKARPHRVWLQQQKFWNSGPPSTSLPPRSIESYVSRFRYLCLDRRGSQHSVNHICTMRRIARELLLEGCAIFKAFGVKNPARPPKPLLFPTDSDRPISPAFSPGQPRYAPGVHRVAISSKLMPRVRARYSFVVDARGRRSTEKDTCQIVCTNHCPQGRNSFASLSAFTKRHGDGVGKSWRRKLVLIDGQDRPAGSLSRFLNGFDGK